MKNFNLKFIYLFIFIFIFSAAGETPAQKLTAEEVIAKHLQSTGTDEARKNLKNQVATGVVQYTVLRKNTGGNGRVVFASEADKFLFGMTFSIPSYPSETFVYDGEKAKIAFAISNARSDLGDFIFRYKDLISDGLFGGTLSTGWVLKDVSSRKAKVDLKGTKKIDNREAYVLQYLPKGGSDLTVNIYIDKENFQHVRTEYRLVVSGMIGPSPDSSPRRGQKETLIEEYSGYKMENGMNLPHRYRIHLEKEGESSGTKEVEYKAEFSEFYFNQQLDPNSFSTEAK